MLMILKGVLNWSKNIKLKNIRAGLVLFDWLIDIFIKSYFWSRSWLRHDWSILQRYPNRLPRPTRPKWFRIIIWRWRSQNVSHRKLQFLIKIPLLIEKVPFYNTLPSKTCQFLIEIGLKLPKTPRVYSNIPGRTLSTFVVLVYELFVFVVEQIICKNKLTS